MFLLRCAWVTAIAVLNVLHVQTVQLQLGQTILTGMDIPTLGQEFFGGTSFLIYPCAGILNDSWLLRNPIF